MYAEGGGGGEGEGRGVEGLTSFIGGKVGELVDCPESVCECKTGLYTLLTHCECG